MTFVIKLLTYVVFFVFIGGTVWAMSKSQERALDDLRRGKVVLQQVSAILLFGALLFGTALIITRFFDFRTILLYLAAASLGAIVTAILWALLGEPHSHWGSQSIATFGELGLSKPSVSIATVVLQALAFLAFLVVIAIILFGQEIPSENATLLTFRFSLIVLVIIPLPIVVGQQMWLLSNENIAEQTRTRVLTGGVGSAIFFAFLLSLLFWSFNRSQEGVRFETGQTELVFSPALALMLLAYVLGLLVAPYIIGYRRASAYRTSLTGLRSSYLDRIIEAIQSAKINPAASLDALAAMRSEINDESTEFIASWDFIEEMLDKAQAEDDGIDPSSPPRVKVIMEALTEYSESPWIDPLTSQPVPTPTSFQVLMDHVIAAIPESWELDVRWGHLDGLVRLRDQIDFLRENIEKVPADQIGESISDSATYFEARKGELESVEADQGSNKPPLVAVGISIVGVVFTQLQGVIGGWVSELAGRLL